MQNDLVQFMDITDITCIVLLLSGSFKLGTDDAFADNGSIGRDHSKKYPGNFCGLGSGFNFIKQVMIFFIAKTSFEYGGSHGA